MAIDPAPNWRLLKQMEGFDPALTLGLLKAISAAHLHKVSAGLTDFKPVVTIDKQ